MKIIYSLAEWQTIQTEWKYENIALVTTMGNLHDGHLELVKAARQYADKIVVSIFVNPTQFGKHEDFNNYPRTLQNDFVKLGQLADGVLVPTVEDIYPFGLENSIKVSLPILSNELCGNSRPEHFAGVTTVLAKLFALIQPKTVFFGEKDWQQLIIVKQLVKDLLMPIQVISVPTQRESDGLAMSSRNQYLNQNERTVAPILYKNLCNMRDEIMQGNCDYNGLIKKTSDHLEQNNFKVDYISVRQPYTLQVLDNHENELMILAAVYLGKTRLIDNIFIRCE